MITTDINIKAVLQIIKNDSDLKEMLLSRFPNIDLDKFLIAKRPRLSSEITEYISAIYENIIAGNTEMVIKYDNIISEQQQQIVKSRRKRLPKEYNKARILIDIKDNGGKATEFHKAMLEVAELKNIRARINAVGKRDRYENRGVLTDEKCAILIAAINDFKKKIKSLNI